MIPSKMELLMRCHGGGGGGAPKVKQPKPPSPTTAAENVAKTQILERQRRARGYSSTMIGSLSQQQESRTLLKQLLGQ